MPTTMRVEVDIWMTCDHPACGEVRRTTRPLGTIPEVLDWMTREGWTVDGDAITGPFKVFCQNHKPAPIPPALDARPPKVMAEAATFEGKGGLAAYCKHSLN